MKQKSLDNEVLPVVLRLLTPFIIIFGVFLQIQGNTTTGGGFQAGVILSLSVIFFSMVSGYNYAMQIINIQLVRSLAAVGVFIYIVIGAAPLLLGGKFLEHTMLFNDPVFSQHFGIFVLELGVGIAVACSMITIYFAFMGFKYDAP